MYTNLQQQLLRLINNSFNLFDHMRRHMGGNVSFALMVLACLLILFVPYGYVCFTLWRIDTDSMSDLEKTFPEHKKQDKPTRETNTSNTLLFKKLFKEENDFLKFMVEMPGLSRKDVKLTVEKNILLIKGDNVEECATKYIRQFEIPTQHYDIYSIKAQMENGVLKVMVPKVKQVKNDSFEVLVLGSS